MMAGLKKPCNDKKYVPQLVKTRLCAFAAKNCCRAGDNCRFAHSPEELREQPDFTHTSMCKTVLKGGICTATDCRFAHSAPELNGEQKRFKTKLCVFAKDRRCGRGSSCSFAHSPEELQPMRSLPLGVDDTAQLDVRPQPLLTAGQVGAPREASIGTKWRGDREPHSVIGRSLDKQRTAAVGGQDFPVPLTGFKGGEASSNESTDGMETPEAFEDFRSSSSDDDVDDALPSPCAPGTEVSDHPQQLAAAAGLDLSALSALPTLAMQVGALVPGWTCTENQQWPPAVAEVSTLLISNVPTYLTQGALLSLLEQPTVGMPNSWNFFFCPWDEVKMCNLGYAVVNFEHPHDAAAFRQALSDEARCCGGGENPMPLHALEPRVQGLRANLKHFSSTPITQCTDPRCQPLYRDCAGVLWSMRPCPGTAWTAAAGGAGPSLPL